MSKSKQVVRPVILCGGSGTRLWPASRSSFPKQFAPLIGERSTFQETLLRVQDSAVFGRPLIVTNRAHRFIAEEQLRELGIAADLLLEPVARDSGPAIIAASLFLQDHNSEHLALVLAADHMVLDVPAFHAAVTQGIAAAAEGRIVTFGIVPTSPATGYGYIAPGEALPGGAKQVARFVEKPDAKTALEYIAKGYLWNSGNFLFSPAQVIEEYTEHDEQSVETVRSALAVAARDLDATVLDEAAFMAAQRLSFDYAVMEKTRNAAVVAGSFGWSDIGGWQALWEISPQDDKGNAAHGDVVFMDCENNYASSDDQLVTLLGVKDLVVVATQDAVLVADKANSAQVKNLVEHLREQGRGEANTHVRVFRPWGWYQTLDLQGRFQVKRIVVYPGGRLSLQKHFHRAEHWVVVKGTARVTVGEKVTELSENQSTYIPLGAVHRLENPGKINVEIIEVQTGAYLGEDDIVRIEDDYARS